LAIPGRRETDARLFRNLLEFGLALRAAPQPALEDFMGEFSLWHWLVVIAVALLLFGPSKLSDLGKGLGEGIRNFKQAVKEGEGSDEKKDAPKTS
jgi:sec-independent protein translocase protein TatA